MLKFLILWVTIATPLFVGAAVGKHLGVLAGIAAGLLVVYFGPTNLRYK